MTIVRNVRHKTARLLSALLLAIAGQTAHADDAKIRALEKRVADLEALVYTLTGTPRPALAPDGPAAAPAAPPAAAPAHSVKIGGYIKADALFSTYSAGDLAPGSAGSQFYIPGTIPIGNGSAEGPDADLQARETRITLGSNHALPSGDELSSYVEMDFFLGGGGDERVSNSYNPRLRQAYVKYNNWLFGQTWSTFQGNGALVENLDLIGPAEGLVFVRQAMIRYTNGPWEFAAENPETTITPFGGGARIVTDDGMLPDLAAGYTVRLQNGQVKIAALLRQLDYDFGTASDRATGVGLSISGKSGFGRDDLRWMATIGSGTGRYVGLNTSNGAVLDANGKLHTIDQMGGFVSYRHFWNDPKWRSNLTLSYLGVDNDTGLTGSAVTKSVYSLHANLLHQPLPKLTLGGELIFARREIESGLNGDMTRLLFSAKYGF